MLDDDGPATTTDGRLGAPLDWAEVRKVDGSLAMGDCKGAVVIGERCLAGGAGEAEETFGDLDRVAGRSIDEFVSNVGD